MGGARDVVDRLETRGKTVEVRRLRVEQETSAKSGTLKIQETHSFEAGITTSVKYWNASVGKGLKRYYWYGCLEGLLPVMVT